MPWGKEEKAIYDREYREKHKEETAIYDRKYYELNKEKRKQQKKLHYQLNKDKIKQEQKEYYQLNKEKLKQDQKEYYQLNIEKCAIYNKEYSQTPAGIKSHRISGWKSLGIILRDDQTWDSIYRKYIECKNCEQCNKEFKNSKDRQLDHCHTTRYIRNIICTSCNVLRGYQDRKNLILE